jgi:hypothetical protein
MPDGKIDIVSGPVLVGNGIPRLERGTFIEAFRARYANAELQDAGRTTFADRPAQAYRVEHRQPGLRETYYLEPDTGLPLGSVLTFSLGGPEAGVGRVTEVVRRLERLPATSENLALLTAPWADGQG